MIGIGSIGSYVPDDHVDNVAQGARFGESEDFIRSKIGATELPRKAVSEETSDLATAAVTDLLERSTLSTQDIDALVLVTQNPDGNGLPHTSALVQNKLGLGSHVAAFDVSLGCSGYVYGLSILKGLMRESGLANGVLVTADPYSKVIDPDDRVTTLLFGDAATATHLCVDAAWEVGRPILETDGSGAEHLTVCDGKLRMNGRQVFNFAVMRVPQQIEALLEREQLQPEDVDVYCLHQGSRAILESISRRFGSVQNRFVIEMDTLGNTVSSTIPLVLQKQLDDPSIRRILISGFGVGLSWASCLLTRRI